MIKVRFGMDEDRGLLSLNMKGHAGMSTVGNDVVCAAASILAYTVAQSVKTASEIGRCKYAPTIKLKGGNAKVVCRMKAENFDEMAHTYLVIQTGFILLNHQYPQFVELHKFGEP